ncbi:competence/damage-inducible protein A [Vagococcus penaei]|uniref:Putative competence-damage inducible protein n=1 Tax=Vagococcus penaei TaxID=633807 RepID=A0A1Q2D724_9ENTE|nr:competence/damage-inducible protein A [Vagococcus penaei]AQP54184.1 competence/damage-inducible protein A [Vagococcus penaei]RST99965.1 competence/damage-inducible protein A [Vagococcus penaei]
MKAEIIAVGTEILLGQITNTNATYISQFLASLGIEVYYHSVVGDNTKRLTETLDIAQHRSDLVVICGGLGPTDDDLTKETVADFLKVRLVYDDEAMNRLNNFFKDAQRPMTENNKKQAQTLEMSTTIQNPAGLACGSYYEDVTTSTAYLLLPGPPSEMKAMVREEVYPLLKEKAPQTHQLVSRYLRFMGIGESRIVTELKELMDQQTNPTIAPYAKSNEVMLRITAKCSTVDDGEAMLDTLEALIMTQVGDFFYGYGENTTIEEVVVNELKNRAQTVTFVEGMTGGECQHRITNIEGSSAIFSGGITAYTRQSKEQLVGISPDLLLKYGEISAECALAMAKAGRQTFGATYGVSIVGVAGPKEIDGQPVGTIIIGLVTPHGEFVERLTIKRNRSYIRDGAVKHGLNFLRKHLV